MTGTRRSGDPADRRDGVGRPPDAVAPQLRNDAVNQPRLSLALAICLAVLAGWVDAVAFIRFHGLFVSFMSGNSTQAGVALFQHDASLAGVFARTIVLFVVGVVTGELVAAAAGHRCRAVLLACVGLLLAVVAAADRARFGDALVASLLAFTMGVQNAVLHKAGAINVSLTYVTGTLVQVGRGLAGALRGGSPWTQPLPFVGLWLGFVGGGLGGAAMGTNWSISVALATASALSVVLLAWVLAVPAAFAASR